MSCEDRELELALHVEGELAPRQAAALEEHLRSCAGCRQLLENLRGSQQALREHTLLADNPPALRGLRGAVLTNLGQGPAPTRSRPALALAASLLLALGAFTLLRFSEAPSPLRPPNPSAALPSASPSAPIQPSIPEPEEHLVEATPLPPAGALPAPQAPEPRLPSQPKAPSKPLNPVPTAIAKLPPTTAKTHPEPTAEEPQTFPQSTVVKLVSDDPDLVIYWLIDSPSPATAPPTTTPTSTAKEFSHDISTR